MTLDVAQIRQHFPSLALEQNGQPVVFFDNPGGTQVTQACIDGHHRLSDHRQRQHPRRVPHQPAHRRAARPRRTPRWPICCNAADPREIVFGPNMTTLTFAFSRALGRTLQRGR